MKLNAISTRLYFVFRFRIEKSFCFEKNDNDFAQRTIFAVRCALNKLRKLCNRWHTHGMPLLIHIDNVGLLPFLNWRYCHDNAKLILPESFNKWQFDNTHILSFHPAIDAFVQFDAAMTLHNNVCWRNTNENSMWSSQSSSEFKCNAMATF